MPNRRTATGATGGTAGDRRRTAGDRRRTAGDRRWTADDRRRTAGDRRRTAGDRRGAAGASDREASSLTRRRLLAAGAGATAAGVAGCLGGRNDGVYAISLSDGTERWHEQVGTLDAGPVVRDGTVYVATDEAFLALAATDGSEQWSFEVDFEHSLDLTSPAPWRDALLAPAHDTLYGLSAADGTERWRFSGADDLDRPGPVVDGVALVPERGGPRVYAVDATDGTERWRFETGGAVTVSAVADSTVVVGSEDEHVYGLSLSDGTERWRVATDAPATGRPAARRGTVFVGTNDRRLLALSVVDGSEQWRWETDGPLGNLTAHSPDATVVGGTLYVESGGVVLAVAPADGTERWRVDTDLSGVSVAVAGDAVLLGGDAHYDNLTSRDSFVEVRAVDRATGRRRWKTALEEGAGSFYHDLVVADGRVCFVSGESTVRALSTADGSGQWTYDVGGLVGQPVVAGETLYFGSI